MKTGTITVLCPRCKTQHYTPYGAVRDEYSPLPPALSRTDNETYICSDCGQVEAMQDFAGEPLAGPDEWAQD